MKFSTSDVRNDLCGSWDCGAGDHGGWWYNCCALGHPTGYWSETEAYGHTGMTWGNFIDGSMHILKNIELRLVPH